MHAIWFQKVSINRYAHIGSNDSFELLKEAQHPIFICFLDLKSAFDWVRNNELFCKLAYRNVSLYIIRLLRNWHLAQHLYVMLNHKTRIGIKGTVRPKNDQIFKHFFLLLMKYEHVTDLVVKFNSWMTCVNGV